MRYIQTRLLGLLNREVSTYEKLISEMEAERKALYSRDLARLKTCLLTQKRLVDEIYDIRKDYQEEKCLLLEKTGYQLKQAAGTMPLRGKAVSKAKASAKSELKKLVSVMGNDAKKLARLEEKIRKLIAHAKEVNKENKRIVEVSHAFFGGYINSLTEMRSRVMGYAERGKMNGSFQQNLMINQQS